MHKQPATLFPVSADHVFKGLLGGLACVGLGGAGSLDTRLLSRMQYGATYLNSLGCIFRSSSLSIQATSLISVWAWVHILSPRKWRISLAFIVTTSFVATACGNMYLTSYLESPFRLSSQYLATLLAYSESMASLCSKGQSGSPR